MTYMIRSATGGGGHARVFDSRGADFVASQSKLRGIDRSNYSIELSMKFASRVRSHGYLVVPFVRIILLMKERTERLFRCSLYNRSIFQLYQVNYSITSESCHHSTSFFTIHLLCYVCRFASSSILQYISIMQ